VLKEDIFEVTAVTGVKATRDFAGVLVVRGGGEAERQMIRALAITDARHEQQEPCRLNGRKRAEMCGHAGFTTTHYRKIAKSRNSPTLRTARDG
jgi:hypothetical protein